MSMTGMNIDDVRTMGKTMQRQADNIKSTIIPELNGLVGKIPAVWSGQDAANFTQWWSEHQNQLLRVAVDLHGLGQSALNNAQEQEDVSNR